MAAYGTNTTLDTLRATNQTVAQFGQDNTFEIIRQTFAIHSQLMREQRTLFMSETTDRMRRGGGSASMAMMELDEFGTPDAQKITAGANIGFPLRRFGGALQWTGLALKRMTTQEIAIQVDGMMDADVVFETTMLKRAIYRPGNYDYDDRFVDHLNSAWTLPVKALANADSFPIPPGPNGETFTESSHTHYLVAATPGTFAAGDLDALITTVREHFGGGKGTVYINQADAATVSGFTKFRAVVDTRIIQPNTATYVNPAFAGLDTVNTNNRLIGIYDGVEIWVKPWAITAYPVACWMGPGIDKPLLYRYDPVLPNDLVLTYEGEVHDLKADVYERYYGISAWNRIAMAVLDYTNSSYTSPV